MRTRTGELLERLHRSMSRRIEGETRELVQKQCKLVTGIGQYLIAARQVVELHLGRLDALDPRKVLERGYSLCLRLPERTVLSSVAAVSPGDSIEIQVRNGSLHSRVVDCVPDHRKGD